MTSGDIYFGVPQRSVNYYPSDILTASPKSTIMILIPFFVSSYTLRIRAIIRSVCVVLSVLRMHGVSLLELTGATTPKVVRIKIT